MEDIQSWTAGSCLVDSGRATEAAENQEFFLDALESGGRGGKPGSSSSKKEKKDKATAKSLQSSKTRKKTPKGAAVAEEGFDERPQGGVASLFTAYPAVGSLGRVMQMTTRGGDKESLFAATREGLVLRYNMETGAVASVLDAQDLLRGALDDPASGSGLLGLAWGAGEFTDASGEKIRDNALYLSFSVPWKTVLGEDKEFDLLELDWRGWDADWGFPQAVTFVKRVARQKGQTGDSMGTLRKKDLFKNRDVVMAVPTPGTTQLGGTLAMDERGRLYVALGSSGASLDRSGYGVVVNPARDKVAQDLRSPLGKVLRIEPYHWAHKMERSIETILELDRARPAVEQVFFPGQGKMHNLGYRYVVPEDNPVVRAYGYIAKPAHADRPKRSITSASYNFLREVWVLGVHDPAVSIDLLTGRVLVTDAGKLHEELTIIAPADIDAPPAQVPAACNLEWPYMDGEQPQKTTYTGVRVSSDSTEARSTREVSACILKPDKAGQDPNCGSSQNGGFARHLTAVSVDRAVDAGAAYVAGATAARDRYTRFVIMSVPSMKRYQGRSDLIFIAEAQNKEGELVREVVDLSNWPGPDRHVTAIATGPDGRVWLALHRSRSPYEAVGKEKSGWIVQLFTKSKAVTPRRLIKLAKKIEKKEKGGGKMSPFRLTRLVTTSGKKLLPRSSSSGSSNPASAATSSSSRSRSSSVSSTSSTTDYGDGAPSQGGPGKTIGLVFDTSDDEKDPAFLTVPRNQKLFVYMGRELTYEPLELEVTQEVRVKRGEQPPPLATLFPAGTLYVINHTDVSVRAIEKNGRGVTAVDGEHATRVRDMAEMRAALQRYGMLEDETGEPTQLGREGWVFYLDMEFKLKEITRRGYGDAMAVTGSALQALDVSLRFPGHFVAAAVSFAAAERQTKVEILGRLAGGTSETMITVLNTIIGNISAARPGNRTNMDNFLDAAVKHVLETSEDWLRNLPHMWLYMISPETLERACVNLDEVLDYDMTMPMEEAFRPEAVSMRVFPSFNGVADDIAPRETERPAPAKRPATDVASEQRSAISDMQRAQAMGLGAVLFEAPGFSPPDPSVEHYFVATPDGVRFLKQGFLPITLARYFQALGTPEYMLLSTIGEPQQELATNVIAQEAERRAEEAQRQMKEQRAAKERAERKQEQERAERERAQLERAAERRRQEQEQQQREEADRARAREEEARRAAREEARRAARDPGFFGLEKRMSPSSQPRSLDLINTQDMDDLGPEIESQDQRLNDVPMSQDMPMELERPPSLESQREQREEREERGESEEREEDPLPPALKNFKVKGLVTPTTLTNKVKEARKEAKARGLTDEQVNKDVNVQFVEANVDVFKNEDVPRNRVSESDRLDSVLQRIPGAETRFAERVDELRARIATKDVYKGWKRLVGLERHPKLRNVSDEVAGQDLELRRGLREERVLPTLGEYLQNREKWADVVAQDKKKMAELAELEPPTRVSMAARALASSRSTAQKQHRSERRKQSKEDRMLEEQEEMDITDRVSALGRQINEIEDSIYSMGLDAELGLPAKPEREAKRADYHQKMMVELSERRNKAAGGVSEADKKRAENLVKEMRRAKEEWSREVKKVTEQAQVLGELKAVLADLKEEMQRGQVPMTEEEVAAAEEALRDFYSPAKVKEREARTLFFRMCGLDGHGVLPFINQLPWPQWAYDADLHQMYDAVALQRRNMKRGDVLPTWKKFWDGYQKVGQAEDHVVEGTWPDGSRDFVGKRVAYSEDRFSAVARATDALYYKVARGGPYYPPVADVYSSDDDDDGEDLADFIDDENDPERLEQAPEKTSSVGAPMTTRMRFAVLSPSERVNHLDLDPDEIVKMFLEDPDQMQVDRRMRTLPKDVLEAWAEAEPPAIAATAGAEAYDDAFLEINGVGTDDITRDFLEMRGIRISDEELHAEAKARLVRFVRTQRPIERVNQTNVEAPDTIPGLVERFNALDKFYRSTDHVPIGMRRAAPGSEDAKTRAAKLRQYLERTVDGYAAMDDRAVADAEKQLRDYALERRTTAAASQEQDDEGHSLEDDDKDLRSSSRKTKRRSRPQKEERSEYSSTEDTEDPEDSEDAKTGRGPSQLQKRPVAASTLGIGMPSTIAHTPKKVLIEEEEEEEEEDTSMASDISENISEDASSASDSESDSFASDSEGGYKNDILIDMLTKAAINLATH